MAPALAARYPDIKTYKVYGIDNPSASGRLSLSPNGFAGMVSSPDGTFYIDHDDGDQYRVARRSHDPSSEPFTCEMKQHHQDSLLEKNLVPTLAMRSPGNLRVYRLALAATEEFVDAAGGTKADAMSAVTNNINRINQVYERDLGVRLELVANTDELFYTGSDPYSNGNTSAMLSENQTNIDNVIGSSNYDIGHVFGIGGGGVAYLGVVCENNYKARGVSTGYRPTGDGFAIDLAAHEFGHQFNAGHSFNGTTYNCGGNRTSSQAWEPGSGSTIMSYAGICGTENVQNSSDAMFHVGSIERINSHTSGSASSCGTLVSINNPSEPVASAGGDYTIPASTPFRLAGSGTDADSDTLSYSWDQMDTGSETNSTTYGTDLGNNPLMRSYLPRASGVRYFPTLTDVLSNANSKVEALATTNRTINMRLTVRDGKSGMDSDDAVITVNAAAGPFRVTSHTASSSINGGSIETVNWDVANTHTAPINCTQVDIDLVMLDEKKENYCVQTVTNLTANSGTAQVILPDLSVPHARFRVSCSNNVFYALSSADLTITGETAASVDCATVAQGGDNETNPIDPPDPIDPSDPIDSPEPEPETDSNTSSDSGGGGTFDLLWFLGLLMIAAVKGDFTGRSEGIGVR